MVVDEFTRFRELWDLHDPISASNFDLFFSKRSTIAPARISGSLFMAPSLEQLEDQLGQLSKHRLGVHQREIRLIFLSEVQPKDSVKPIKDTSEISYVIDGRSVRRQLLQVASQDVYHMGDFQVSPIHRGSRIVAANQLGDGRIHGCLLSLLVRKHFRHQETVEFR
jgi:hypothetical protein